MSANSNAQILQFPKHKAWLQEGDIEDLKTQAFEFLESDEIIHSESPDLSNYIEETIKDFNLPPFVLKMRKIGSINQQIDHIQKMSLELEYFLNEIELYTK